MNKGIVLVALMLAVPILSGCVADSNEWPHGQWKTSTHEGYLVGVLYLEGNEHTLPSVLISFSDGFHLEPWTRYRDEAYGLCKPFEGKLVNITYSKTNEGGALLTRIDTIREANGGV
jgi:hypothetical protein